jgi:hypothetical protein
MPESNAPLENKPAQNSTPPNSTGGESIRENDKPSRNQRRAVAPEQPARPPALERMPDKSKSAAPPADGERRALNLRELFTQKDGDESGALDLDEPDDPAKPVKNLEHAAKRLGMKAEDVYKILVPMKDGAPPIALGELKDRVGELVDLDARVLEFETRRVKNEGETLRSQQELRDLMAMIPRDKITPELLQRVRSSHEATRSREVALTLEHIPSWTDERSRTADLTKMVSMLSDYGLPESFITTVVDHRALKFIRDSMVIRERIMKALKDVKIPPRKGATPPSANRRAPSKPANTPSRRVPDNTERGRIMTFLDSTDS